MIRYLSIGAALIAVIGGAALAYAIGTSQAMRTMIESQNAITAAQQSYLVDRFRAAYEFQQPAIVLWEGTNLLSHLMQESPSPTSKEELAKRLFLNARVSAVFHEIGDRDGEQRYADQALALFGMLQSNAAATAEAVVSNCLAKDTLKRRYAGPKQ